MPKVLDRIRPFLRHQINTYTCGPGSKIVRRQTWRQFLGRACAYYPASLPRGMATTIFDLYPLISIHR